MATEEENTNTLLIFFAIIIGSPIILAILWSIVNLIVVKQKEAMIIERWGKFHKRLDAGLHFLVPIMDKPRGLVWREMDINSYGRRPKMTQGKYNRIDLRQRVMDFELQPIITRDNVEIGVHPLLIFEIIDPIRAVYETYDLNHAVGKLVQTTLRSIIGDMGLDDTLASREEINRGILRTINHICLNWGIKICRVELLEIVPTDSVQNAMHHQLAAERLRRAVIVQADGYREKVKTEAEGFSQAEIALATGTQKSAVIRAKASADARILIARAEAAALEKVGEALRHMDIDVTQYMIALKYMETFTSIATSAHKRKIFLPLETNIVGAIGLMSSTA